MAQVDFYTGTINKLLIACRLCAKAVQQAQRTLVYVPDSALAERFDKLLWTFSSIDFIPHCHAENPLAVATPVVLDKQIPSDAGHYFQIVLNLDTEIPPNFESVQRVIEVVDETATEDKQLARQRYRLYQQQGHHLRHYQLNNP